MAHAYRTCIADLHRKREREEAEALDLRTRQDIYMKKLKDIRQRFMECRDTLTPILEEVSIDIRVESWEHAAQILRLRHDYKNYILFAIAPKEVKHIQRWRYSGFMAILGDFARNEITLYEYSDEIDRKNSADTATKRNEFEKHAWRLVNIPIDHFDFEAVKPFIKEYLAKELNYIALQYPSLKLPTFDTLKSWNTIPQQTTSNNYYQTWNPILSLTKYLKNQFARAKKK